ncbi:MAG TPA: ABC transporter permease subunit [Amaricoccus sp.]|uniref:ABC transporter permease n=1 Tax=Amaricoccus sp. TaxID=1872485 RepID=UPI002CCFCA2A|nr:ABC transporter permease subunit [Amaricoccus sp.]HMQ92819.1 ABC transporter permease subunit [Amaricoccus sp.]HMR52841.1 ABC transporter permease subunit [Amaricoccus sp.]HMR60815.1 ABC transporter permease subunit [Amaricoccus sp.]HMT99776.1 ABC transporter permease subunit [Amaricoccus sp.]
MTIYGYRLPAMSSLVLWAVLWEIVGRSGLTFFIPPLSEVLQTLFQIVGTPAFQNALTETVVAFLAGILAAVTIGIPVGILMGKSRLVDELLLPWVNMFLSAPLTALVPVLMVLFGFGMKSIVITTTLFAIWIIILNSRAGVKQIDRSLVEMARCFGASPLDAFYKVYFWAALPEILGGVRIGVIRGVKGVIIGQLLISVVGFGALFELYSSNFLMSHFWAVLLVLFAMAFALSELLAHLERRVSYYAAKR